MRRGMRGVRCFLRRDASKNTKRDWVGCLDCFVDHEPYVTRIHWCKTIDLRVAYRRAMRKKVPTARHISAGKDRISSYHLSALDVFLQPNCRHPLHALQIALGAAKRVRCSELRNTQRRKRREARDVTRMEQTIARGG